MIQPKKIGMLVAGALLVHALSMGCVGSGASSAHAGTGVGGLDPGGGTGGGSCTCPAPPVLTATMPPCDPVTNLAVLALPGRSMVDILQNVRMTVGYTNKAQPPAPTPPLLAQSAPLFYVGEGVVAFDCSPTKPVTFYH